MEWVFAFLAGVLGALIGGLKTFIMTGFIGIIGIILAFLGVNIALYEAYLNNLLFLPCVIFTGAVGATALASRYFDIKGYEITRSLAGFTDCRILLCGGICSTLGYLFFELMSYLPIDAGALSMLSVGILIRFVFSKKEIYSQEGLMILKNATINYWLFQVILAGSVAFVTGYLVELSGYYTLGFFISALSLIFALTDDPFPVTHHITLIAGYSMMLTHSLVIAFFFGILSHLSFIGFNYTINRRCGTHIDSPAFAISLCSFILFTFF